jgi:hypothetical protein
MKMSINRTQLWEWKTKKVIPKPKTIEKIEDKEKKEEVAMIAISHYLPFVSKNRLLKELKGK